MLIGWVVIVGCYGGLIELCVDGVCVGRLRVLTGLCADKVY